jgi:NACHT domain
MFKVFLSRPILTALLAAVCLAFPGGEALASSQLALPTEPPPPHFSGGASLKSAVKTSQNAADLESPTKSKLKGEAESGFWDKVIDWLFRDSDPHTLRGALKWAVILILTLSIFIHLVAVLAEKLAKLFEAYKSAGFPITFSSKTKAQLLRRRQFCNVLAADLATLAKAENWNDQYFADLEAEVEAEGGYYSSVLRRFLKRPSHGLRRVPSLIEALESSSEQTLLLVGEPGSGKSVALRHLAHQLARRGSRSSDLDAKVPLYLNLKELSISAQENLNADFIKGFVLDNIRRGDADTAAYVREKWDEYRQRGIWFFLFDSFDEIPAVLHAPAGSTVIRGCSEAIRTFLEGMSSCRGIVASREFKGPDSLPWQKFRILNLSDRRQDELIERSFLESDQKKMVRQHLATSETTLLRGNPLFLTLLCRYVKDELRVPANDQDLLGRHIVRLADRDQDYIKRKYDLSPSDLLVGARRLAVLLAETPSLSLAPTQAEILNAFVVDQGGTAKIEDLLAALVDVKIGRSDIREARAGDRRFTFSHRRYQETLFVSYLAENPTHIPPRELLTNIRWREYTVALLQTEAYSVLASLMEEAGRLLEEIAVLQKPKAIRLEFGGHLGYYTWGDENHAASLLSLLQEGLLRREPLFRNRLAKQVTALLRPRWEMGDFEDRIKVLELGGLLEEGQLTEFLLYAVNSLSAELENIAFGKAEGVGEAPPDLVSWVRYQLSESILGAGNSSELRRTEALAARLPRSFKAQQVLRRSRLLRFLLLPGNLYFNFTMLIMSLLPGALSPDAKTSFRRRFPGASQALGITQMLVLTPLLILPKIVSRFFGFIYGATALVVVMTTTLLYFLRSGSPRRVWSRQGSRNELDRFGFFLTPGFFALALVSFFAPRPLSRNLALLLMVAGVFVPFAWMIKYMSKRLIIEMRANRRFASLSKELSGEIYLQASNLRELDVWLRVRGQKSTLSSEDKIRSLCRLLMSDPKDTPVILRDKFPLFRIDWPNDSALPRVIALLQSRLGRARTQI